MDGTRGRECASAVSPARSRQVTPINNDWRHAIHVISTFLTPQIRVLMAAFPPFQFPDPVPSPFIASHCNLGLPAEALDQRTLSRRCDIAKSLRKNLLPRLT